MSYLAGLSQGYFTVDLCLESGVKLWTQVLSIVINFSRKLFGYVSKRSKLDFQNVRRSKWLLVWVTFVLASKYSIITIAPNSVLCTSDQLSEVWVLIGLRVFSSPDPLLEWNKLFPEKSPHH